MNIHAYIPHKALPIKNICHKKIIKHYKKSSHSLFCVQNHSTITLHTSDYENKTTVFFYVH